MAKHWARFTNPSRKELETWLRSPLAGELQLEKLHPVALDALFNFDAQLRDPFPRIESHGNYVFGMLAAPTSVQDAVADYCVLHFVADFDEIITVLRSSKSFDTTSIESDLNGLTDLSEGPNASTGLIFAKAAEVFLTCIELSAKALKKRVEDDLRGITSVRDSLTYRTDLGALAKLHEKAVKTQTEVLGLKTLVEETKNLLTAVATNTVDVKRTEDNKSEDLFPQFVEIMVTDLLMRARHLKAIQSNLQDDLDAVFKHHLEMQSVQQTAASKRFTGVLSILFLPQLIVAFFGQSFREAPLYDNQYGWIVSLLLVALVSACQFVWFKRKKFL
jgi:Mg2+ and Co2+ transporter CorA